MGQDRPLTQKKAVQPNVSRRGGCKRAACVARLSDDRCLHSSLLCITTQLSAAAACTPCNRMERHSNKAQLPLTDCDVAIRALHHLVHALGAER